MSEALFKYSLRVSARGRYVRLRVSLRGDLEIVVPKGFDPSKVPELLERKKQWIRAALEYAEANNESTQRASTWQLPPKIELAGIGRILHVNAKETPARRVMVRDAGQDLLVSGAIADESACRAALGRWLMRQAWEQLLPRLQTLSAATGLRYKRALVRRQRTRWGSCSRQRSISLNAKLLFLPRELMDYVMVHELCHTVQMNHSPRYWDLVERHSPDCRVLDKRLRDAWKAVPRWAG